MGRDLYFYRIHKDKLPILADVISQEGKLSFRNFLISQGGQDSDFNKIVESIQYDISRLSDDDFWDLVSWFHKKSSTVYADWIYKAEKELQFCGIEKFFELNGKLNVSNFLCLQDDYNCIDKNGFSMQCWSPIFNGFLNFLICYAGEIVHFENKYYKESPKEYHYDENKVIEKLIKDISPDDENLLHKQVLSKVRNDVKFYNDTVGGKSIELTDHDIDFVWYRHVFHIAKELKEKMERFEGYVVLLDS